MSRTLRRPSKVATMASTAATTAAAMAAMAAVFCSLATPAFAADELNSGDTAWMLTSSLLVLMMTIPGVALFYGGMVRKKN
ncbi:MAG: ammonia channel protein, partial [Alphaproteobacteria bacterium]|nr:ammonia channel protein [Alphaproteobacteria bacterium]